jgi:MoaA/NifB/PqqE/SkfB family radical SAM enzyme
VDGNRLFNNEINKRRLAMKYPLILKWSITDECNLRCKHCFRSERTKAIERNEIDLLIDDFSCVALTGGEPLLHKDFLYIINSLQEHKIYTEVATNGILLDEEIVKYLYNKNVSKIQISIDGPDERTNDFIRGEGAYSKIIKSIKLLKHFNIEVALAVTLNHLNVGLIDEFVLLKKTLNIEYLRFELYVPVNEDQNNLRLLREDINNICRTFSKYRLDSFISFLGLSNGISCGAGTSMCMINTDLTISPCDLLCDEIRSSQKISKLNSMKEIWNNDDVIVEWRKDIIGGCKAAALKDEEKTDPYMEVYLNE